jgi:type IV secretory pathway TrbD component
MALSHGAIIAIVIFGCAAFSLCGYAIWAVMFKNSSEEFTRTRPQDQQAEYMRQVRHNNIEAFSYRAGKHHRGISDVV